MSLSALLVMCAGTWSEVVPEQPWQDLQFDLPNSTSVARAAANVLSQQGAGGTTRQLQQTDWDFSGYLPPVTTPLSCQDRLATNYGEANSACEYDCDELIQQFFASAPPSSVRCFIFDSQDQVWYVNLRSKCGLPFPATQEPDAWLRSTL